MMPKRFRLKTVARKADASDSGRTEHQTLTVVTQPPVVTTRTLDGQIISPDSAASHPYGTVRTTMTVVETRVSSSRAEGSSSSSSSTLVREASQRSQTSTGVQLAGVAASGQLAIEAPQPAVRRKISHQTQSDERTGGAATDHHQMAFYGQSSGESGAESRVSNAGSTSAGGQSGAGLGSASSAFEDSARISDTPSRLAQVPADFSAPQQLPASATTLAGRTPATPATNVKRGVAPSTSPRRPQREPDELTAIRPSPATNINPSGPDSTAPNEASDPHAPPHRKPGHQKAKGASPLTGALTPAPDEAAGESSDGEPRRRYPKKVLLIVANEFCERFSYYGLRTVLVLYFHTVLGFSDSGSAISFHLFAALCYLTPLLGAILGDSILGKYKTILYLSMVYFFGELLLVLASIWWDLGAWSVALTWLALVLIGVGTGGIKPCVSAFGGDQFRASEASWRESFFSLFYMSINLGSLISMFATPMLRAQNRCVGRSDCYPLAFLVPCVLMFASIVIFLLASSHYYHAPLPEKNVLVAFCQCAWLALKRKLAGHRPAHGESSHLFGYSNPSLSDSGSNLSASETTTPVVVAHKQLGGPPASDTTAQDEAAATVAEAAAAVAAAAAAATATAAATAPITAISAQGSAAPQHSTRRNHWLHLAADRFDANSIEEFRCCLGIFLLFLPTPVYWALYDQQSSLWTLQANRMDGRLFGSAKFALEPDQMGVLNPLLLLAAIPLFQFAVYPLLGKCRLLTTPIQRMATGGFLMALTFVASALIELQIQQRLPLEVPRAGRANLILVNGLNDCSLVEPRIARTTPNVPANLTAASTTAAPLPPGRPFGGIDIQAAESLLVAALQPLSSHTLEVLAAAREAQPQPAGLPYRLTFRLASSTLTGEPPYSPLEVYAGAGRPNASSRAALGQQAAGCPLDASQTNELSVGPLDERSVRLLYVDQGNGKLGYKLFEDSAALPPAGKARVRLLYEFFGSHSQAKRRQFRLYRNSGTAQENAAAGLQFAMGARQGQVLLSDHLDMEVPSSGDSFTLVILDERGRPMASPSQQRRLFIERGTRNLLVLHQTDAASHKLRQEVLQGNDYRISILWQLVPYAMISFSEVLFSITGLEFSYASAPADMKSLVLAAWILSASFGNLLTVAIESAHLFANIAYDFLFYALIMCADSVLFSLIGYHYEPYQPALASHSARARKLQ